MVLVAILYKVWISTITQKLCFLLYASAGILLGNYLVTAYLSYYTVVYSTVFVTVFSVYIVRVGWVKTMII